MSRLPILVGVLLLGACMHGARPQHGGGTTTTLGGASAPTTVTAAAPENPSTPTTTLVEKTTQREWAMPVAPRGERPEARGERPISDLPAPISAPASAPASPPSLLRETISERSTTTLGAAQKDTARELGARLQAVSPFVWIGALLVPVGLFVAYRAWSEWKINAILLGVGISGSGVAMAMLAVWGASISPLFGLFGLLLVVVAAIVWGVYYRAHHDAAANPFLAANPAAPSSSSTPTAAP